jgi:hypothetical protein
MPDELQTARAKTAVRKRSLHMCSHTPLTRHRLETNCDLLPSSQAHASANIARAGPGGQDGGTLGTRGDGQLGMAEGDKPGMTGGDRMGMPRVPRHESLIASRVSLKRLALFEISEAESSAQEGLQTPARRHMMSLANVVELT